MSTSDQAQLVDHAAGWQGSVSGLWHAPVGWMLRGKGMPNPARYAKRLSVAGGLASPDRQQATRGSALAD